MTKMSVENPREAYDSLPDLAREEIMRIVNKEESKERKQKRFIELVNAYMKSFGKIAGDDQFSDDRMRHKYVTAVINKRYGHRQPTVERTIIPVGVDGLRETSSGKFSNVFILDKADDFKKIKTLVLRGDAAEQYSEITLENQYKVEVGVLKDGSLISSVPLDFSQPDSVDIKTIIKDLPIDRITLDTANRNLSKTIKSNGKEFAEKTDWKCLKGMIQRKTIGKNATTGREWGMYVVSDMTVEEEKTLADGTLIEETLTMWTDPSIMHYPEESWCDFYGTVSKYEKDSKKRLSFSCYYINPLIIPGEEF